MKKAITFLLSVSLFFSLTACGGKDSEAVSGEQENRQKSDNMQTEEGALGMDQNGLEDAGTSQAGFGDNDEGAQGTSAGGTGGLQFLASENMEGCHTKDGYYYQTFEADELTDGNYGSHLMYMDFAALQEVYLCSNAGCGHNSPDCTAVLPYDDFPIVSTLLFVWQDSLYILSKQPDNDGSMSMTIYYGEYAPMSDETEGSAAVLYRANLDGTGREVVHAFDPSLVLEDLVLGDESGIYVVVKKLITEQSSEGTYFNSAERRLVHLDLSSGKEQEICSLEFDGYISWRLKGCYDRTLVLEGMDYGREVSNEELFSDDAYKNLYENSQEVFATVALEEPRLKIQYRQDNGYDNHVLADGNMLYTSKADGSVTSFDFRTGTERELCRLDRGSYLYRKIGNKLCCDSGSGDSTYDYIDVDTGEVSHSSLVNKSLGWHLEFRAVLDSEVLVIYDYDAVANGDGSYEINRYQYGLISMEDLFAGTDNFRKINMIGKGE